MSENVQSMLNELREEMSSFEGSLPDVSDRDALDGLLGIRHALVDRWKAQQREAAEVIPPRSDGPWELSLAALLMTSFPLAALWYVRGVNAVVGGVILVVMVVATLFFRRWLAQPPTVRGDTDEPLAKKQARIDEDPVFLIDEVQAYVQEQVDAAHSRFSAIRMQFEKAVIQPRQKAETTLVTLRQRRQDALAQNFPDGEQILAQIDRYIAECERLLHPNFDEEQVAKHLRDTGEHLQALYKYPAQLEQVKAAYQSQADFVADLDDVGVDIDAIQSSRSTTMMAVASQLRDLRGEIGLTNRLMDGFQDYLAAQPDLQEALASGRQTAEALSIEAGS
jgi:hypothetical protein